jgi:proline iminopeptidase
MADHTGYVPCAAGELFYESRGLNGGVPLVAVHGGPGFTSYYLEPLFELSGIVDVVCYDQSGCGRARRAGARKDVSIAGFVEELERLREALGIKQMHLLGHSFGGAIVGEYALAYPAHARSVIFACASLDIPRWIADGERLLGGMQLMQKMIIREGLRTGQYSSEPFLRALGAYYAKHVYGFGEEKPDCIQRSERESDTVTYQSVWGPNELVVQGLCKDYNLAPRLGGIKAPALFICGRFDEATPEAHHYFSSCLEGSRCHIFERSAHHPQITEREEFLATVREFVMTTR